VAALLGPPPDVGAAAPVPAAAAAKPLNLNEINPRLLRRFRAIVAPVPASPAEVAQIALGKQLFSEKRLSLHRDVACATCHPLDHGGTDHLPTARDVHGAPHKRNAPTVYNAAGNIAQQWDGRARSLEDQARLPLLNPDEMAMGRPEAVTAALRAIPAYAPAFAAAFPSDPAAIDFDHAITAIAAFERTLVTPARWDRFLSGDRTALSAAELDGMKLFADVGCVQCHTGVLVGGSMFQRVGVARPWPNQDDLGRFTITHDGNDRMVFKVPSLRNIAITSPYFHDGGTASLSEAVKMMARYQLDTELTDDEVTSIVAWLGALTGEPPPGVLIPPVLPPG